MFSDCPPVSACGAKCACLRAFSDRLAVYFEFLRSII